MDPLSVTASVAGLLGLTLQVSQIVYEQVHTLKNATKDAAKLLEELELLCQVLTSLEQFLASQSSKGRPFKETSVFIKAIGGCKTQIGAIKMKLDKLVGKQGVALIIERGKWYYEHDEHQQLIQTIHRYIGIFQVSLGVDGIGLLSKSVDDVTQEIKSIKSAISALTNDPREAEAKAKQLDDILNLLLPLSDISENILEITSVFQRWDLKWQDEESQKILDWLSPLNFWEKQHDALSRRETGTGQWILENPAFKGWLDRTRRVLWCPGMPGAGKTVLSSVVIDHLQNTFLDDDISIAFIYCNYKEQEEQTLVNLIASLVRQVLQRRHLPIKLHALYKHHTIKNTRPNASECLELLHNELSSVSRAFLVIDALDECNDKNETRTMLLNNLLKLPTTTSLIVTSRHVPSIELQLDQSCRLEIRASDRDIRVYLERQIQRKERLKRHTQKDSSLVQAILEKVVKAAQGMFLLAQLHIDALSQKHTPKAVRTALQNLPEKLDRTYDEAMARIRSQNIEDVDLAHRVLAWISFALRPLTVAEMRHAISIQPGQTSMEDDDLIDEEILVSVCAGLVVIDQESEVIRLVHYTTQDYFDRNRRTQLPDGQTDITSSCLTYLSFAVFQSGYCNNDEQMEARLQNNPLFDYASKNWGNHARGSAETRLRSQILEFFTRGPVLSSMAQALLLPPYRFIEYSQDPPKDIFGLWVAAMFGLSAIVTVLLEVDVDLNLQIGRKGTALHAAAENGYEGVVQLLLEKGADIKAKNKSGWTALHGSAQNEHTAVVQLLLEKGADIKAGNISGLTALHVAARNGHKDMMRLLIENGADIEVKNRYGETALHIATQNGREVVVQLLLEKGADIEAKDNKGEIALYKAARHRHEAVLRLLLEKGGGIKAKNNIERIVLHLAAGYGLQTVVKLLLENRAYIDIEAKGIDGETALHEAAQNGHEVVVRLLLEKGADIEAKNNIGWTALHLAAQNGHGAVVRLLLENKADIDIKGKENDGATALHEATRNGYEIVVRLLLEEGADIKAENNIGWTALHLAAQNGHGAVVRLLLENKADIDIEAKESNGETALHQAARNGYEVVVQLLLEEGADVNAKDYYGETPLHEAARNGYEVVVRLLLEKGADVNTKDCYGQTGLCIAVRNGREAEVRLLLEKGADIEATDSNGETALHAAAQIGYKTVVQLLLEKGADIKAENNFGWTARYLAAQRGHEAIVQLLTPPIQNSPSVSPP